MTIIIHRINTLSKAVQASFSRVQFTTDLLPADVVGTMIYNIKDNKKVANTM